MYAFSISFYNTTLVITYEMIKDSYWATINLDVDLELSDFFFGVRCYTSRKPFYVEMALMSSVCESVIYLDSTETGKMEMALITA